MTREEREKLANLIRAEIGTAVSLLITDWDPIEAEAQADRANEARREFINI